MLTYICSKCDIVFYLDEEGVNPTTNYHFKGTENAISCPSCCKTEHIVLQEEE